MRIISKCYDAANPRGLRASRSHPLVPPAPPSSPEARFGTLVVPAPLPRQRRFLLRVDQSFQFLHPRRYQLALARRFRMPVVPAPVLPLSLIVVAELPSQQRVVALVPALVLVGFMAEDPAPRRRRRGISFSEP